MHRIARLQVAAVVFALTLLAMTTASFGFCLMNCEPTEDNARSVLQNMVKSIVPNAPFSVLQFQKTNGSTVSVMGVQAYQLFYHAVVEFPSGISPGRSQQNIWNQLRGGADAMEVQTRLSTLGLRVTKGNKIDEDTIMESNSAVVFQKTEKGWLGPDGHVY